MGEKVVVAGGIIECGHGGQIQLSGGDARLKVSSNAVITMGMEIGLTFASVAAPPTFPAPCTAVNPSGAPTPCVVTTPALTGFAMKLGIGSVPALLASANGLTISGAGPGTWQVSEPGQSLLEAS